jgi:hypothetical protein
MEGTLVLLLPAMCRLQRDHTRGEGLESLLDGRLHVGQPLLVHSGFTAGSEQRAGGLTQGETFPPGDRDSQRSASGEDLLMNLVHRPMLDHAQPADEPHDVRTRGEPWECQGIGLQAARGAS